MSASQDNFSQSFALQFISLILFILIFTIWSFLPKMVNQTKTKEVTFDRVLSEKASDKAPLFQSTLEKKYFVDDHFSLNESAWEPIRQLIFQHDLSLHIKMKSVSDARALFERLVESEFPEESILVEADEKIATEELMVVSGASTWQ